MTSSVVTETETVIKKILPYLRRREYDIENDLDFETPVKTTTRYTLGYADILVTLGKTKPTFVIEAKRSSRRLTVEDRDQAINYGKSLGVLFAVVTNGSEIQCFNVSNGEPIKWNGKLTQKIPTKSQLSKVMAVLKANTAATTISLTDDESLPFRPGLPLKQLNALFARCHNAIRKIEKDEDNAFADFSKLLFLKLLEEKADNSDFVLPYSNRFFELADRPDTESDQVQTLIVGMVEKIKHKTSFGEVLDDPLKLKNPKTFQYIVRELSHVSFQDCNLDSKGAAFEYFVRATLKGKKLGQYFTPRPLIELMAHIVGKEKVLSALQSGNSVKVLDPACGTGGFLVYLMQENLHALQDKLESRKIIKRTHDDLAEKVMRQVFFGSDANSGVACAAKMNMIIAGDGHTNIQPEDSLGTAAKNWHMSQPDCDIILTNPPFGTSESDSLSKNDLNQYPLQITKGQLLFLQKMVLCTVPGGDICTVIDEGVLNTNSAKRLRKWLFEKCEVVAIVRLPDETFEPNKINVKASVLYLRRREHDDIDYEDDYPVTFCDIESLGYTGAGDSIRDFDTKRLMSEIAGQLLEKRGINQNGYKWSAFSINAQTILTDAPCRIDYKYWQPETRQKIDELRKAGGQTIKELNTIKTNRGASPPADLYVDEGDGYALVVKAGSSISKYGELLTDGDYIEKDLFDGMTNSHVLDGDVLLSSTGDGTIGKCCVYRSGKPAIADGHVTIIRPDPTKVYPEYLCDYLRVGFGHAQIERLFTGSTGLVELTKDHVDSVVVNLLSGVEEQKTLSQKLRENEQTYIKDTGQSEAALRNARNIFAEA
ncbi:MAG: N-6 DNA methylase [Anaerolineales bacterium]